MYPPKFDYVRAESVSEAVSLLQDNDGASLLAGGHSLLPLLKLRLAAPSLLVDIGRIDSLRGIGPRRDGSFSIGALTTHGMVAAASGLPTVLTEAAGWIGDPQVRNRGTVGGNVAHADPASDLPTVFTALGATVHIDGPDGSRSVNANDFCTDLFTTDLNEHEIVTEITVPAAEGRTGSAYAKMFNPASRYAMLGAAAVVTMDNGRCKSARVAIGSLTPAPQRAPSVEAALQGKALDDETIAAAARAVLDDLGDELLGDIHASAEYRRKTAPAFVRRALSKAVERAQG